MTASILGIDFGSAYTRAAYWNSQSAPEVLREDSHLDSTALLPSAVLKQGQSVLVGWPARRTRVCGDSVPLSLKRQWHDGNADAISSAGLILKEAKKVAGQILKAPVSQAAFSVPALWNETRRRQFETAVREAGFESLGMIPETAAVGLAYGYLKKKTGLAGIYNFGGGIFEFGVVRLQEGRVEWLAAASAPVGGEDFDLCIAQGFLKEMDASWKEAVQQDGALFQVLMGEAEKARCSLSHRGSYDFQIEDPKRKQKFVRAFSRFELAKWLQPGIDKRVEACESAMKKAGVHHQDIQEVILAGGVTRMPFVHENVEKIFRRKPVVEINPDLAVVYGALLYASIQSGQLAGWNVEIAK